MPPRHTYWTIILEGKPTAFRAHTPDELMPTLRQLQARHPDAVMKWFARGKLWESPLEARAAFERRSENRPRRDSGWRPGGAHRDPRDRFDIPRDEKRRRFAAKLRRERSDAPVAGSPGRGSGRPKAPSNRRPWQDGRNGPQPPRRRAEPRLDHGPGRAPRKKPGGGGGRRGGPGGSGR